MFQGKDWTEVKWIWSSRLRTTHRTETTRKTGGWKSTSSSLFPSPKCLGAKWNRWKSCCLFILYRNFNLTSDQNRSPSSSGVPVFFSLYFPFWPPALQELWTQNLEQAGVCVCAWVCSGRGGNRLGCRLGQPGMPDHLVAWCRGADSPDHGSTTLPHVALHHPPTPDTHIHPPTHSPPSWLALSWPLI